MGFVLGTAKGSPSLVSPVQTPLAAEGGHSRGATSLVAAVLEQQTRPLGTTRVRSHAASRQAEAGERGRISSEETGLSQSGRQAERRRHMESRSHRRTGRDNIGSGKAWCSGGCCAEQLRVTQPVTAWEVAEPCSESQRRCSPVLPGERAAFAPGRKSRRVPARKSAAGTPSEKPLALLPETSGSGAAAGLEKIGSSAIAVLLSVVCGLVVGCLHQVPGVRNSPPRCPCNGESPLHSGTASWGISDFI